MDEPFGRDLAVEPERGELDETVQDRDGVVVEATVEAIETHRKEHLEDSCHCRPAVVATTEILQGGVFGPPRWPVQPGGLLDGEREFVVGRLGELVACLRLGHVLKDEREVDRCRIDVDGQRARCANLDEVDDLTVEEALLGVEPLIEADLTDTRIVGGHLHHDRGRLEAGDREPGVAPDLAGADEAVERGALGADLIGDPGRVESSGGRFTHGSSLAGGPACKQAGRSPDVVEKFAGE